MDITKAKEMLSKLEAEIEAKAASHNIFTVRDSKCLTIDAGCHVLFSDLTGLCLAATALQSTPYFDLEMQGRKAVIDYGINGMTEESIRQMFLQLNAQLRDMQSELPLNTHVVLCRNVERIGSPTLWASIITAQDTGECQTVSINLHVMAFMCRSNLQCFTASSHKGHPFVDVSEEIFTMWGTNQKQMLDYLEQNNLFYF